MIRAILNSFVLSSLSGLLIASLACTDDDIPTTPTAATTPILEGVEIVKTIPPTAEGDEPEPLNSNGP